jgi:hypothetical protein
MIRAISEGSLRHFVGFSIPWHESKASRSPVSPQKRILNLLAGLDLIEELSAGPEFLLIEMAQE